MPPLLKLPFIDELENNITNHSQFIQVILGPRQVGKTTGIGLFLKKYKKPYVECTADDIKTDAYSWLNEQWQRASELGDETLLVIDEIQKIHDWSSHIKQLWDSQRKIKTKLKLILLGSSSLQLQEGLSESLTGRFQVIRAYHWGYNESNKLKKMSLKDYLTFGGYPGSYTLIKNQKNWNTYIQQSIVDTVIDKDILRHAKVKNYALFKQTFHLLASLPAQEISYTKLLGQLQEKGNTDLIKYYIQLFEGAYLFRAIQKYNTKSFKVKTSSPKIIPLGMALIDRFIYSKETELGHIFEAAVGAKLIQAFGDNVYYWRDGDFEVDYVIELDSKIIAIEVKSGKAKSSKSLTAFQKKFPKSNVIFINSDNFMKFDLDPELFILKLV
jgi:predicted AAA+ superfamily ATPase